MKNKILLLLGFNLLSATLTFGLNPISEIKTNEILFTENKGQVSDQFYKSRKDVLFSGHSNGMVFHLRNNGVSYQLYRINKWGEVEDPKFKHKSKTALETDIYRLDINWLNCNINSLTHGETAIPGVNNYYLASCPDGALNVKSYAGVFYKNIYKNIDLHYYEKKGALKYDYIVAPGADYKQIKLQIKGAEEITASKNGGIVITTPFGKIEEGAPIVFQNNVQLKANWKIENNVLSFEIKNYNPHYELIIDPAVRVWGTYYGGTADDWGMGSCTDPAGNVYITGYTTSMGGTLVATTGAHQDTLNATASTQWLDAFLVKFNSAGVRLWGTYYGGPREDRGLACATDAMGNVYMTGFSYNTNPTNVLSTAGGHQQISSSGNDAYLVKFNSAGIRQWATYYGGTGGDEGQSCATDAVGNVYIGGVTSSGSSTLIATLSSHQAFYAGGSYDGFLVQFNSAGVRQWGTYYGGSGGDYGYECCTDAQGNVYLVGSTNTSAGTQIGTTGSHQSSFGGYVDGFAVNFNSAGVRQWGTYYGGADHEAAMSCVVDPSGDFYITGITSSTTAIATPLSHQTTHANKTSSDAFLVKFDPSGVRQWGTYYGGNNLDYSYSCSADLTGNVYIAGWTTTTVNLVIATPGSHQSAATVGGAFLAKFNTAGIRQWGTYYGAGNERANDCVTDVSGAVYLVGECNGATGNIIATNGSHQPNFGGVVDAFLVKFKDCTPPQPPVNTTPVNDLIICAGKVTTLAATSTGTINWLATPNATSSLASGNAFVIPILTSGTYTWYAQSEDNCTSSLSLTPITVTVHPLPQISVNSGSVCVGQTFTMNPSGASTYTFSSGQAIVNPVVTTTYNVMGTSNEGCVSTNPAVSQVTVSPLPMVTVAYEKSLICAGENAVLTVSGALTYTWIGIGSSLSVTVSPLSNTNYTVTGTDANGCINTAETVISVDLCTGIFENVSEISGFNVYPNPCNGEFTIYTELSTELTILNAIGQVVLNRKLEVGVNNFDLSEQPKGVYLLKLKNDTFKIIKE